MILAVLAASYSLVQSMVNPALPPLQAEYAVSTSQLSWVLIGFLLASAVATPVVGRLGDQLGNGRVIVATTLALVVGSAICALAPTLTVLVVGRVVQGIGGATLPLAFALVRQLLPSARVSAAVGMIAAITSVGGGLGVLVAGPIVDHLGVGWLFWMPAILNTLVAIALLFVVPLGKGAGGRTSWTAALSMSGFLVALLLVLSLGCDWGWASWWTIGLSAAAVLLALAWIALELRSADPIIDMRLMAKRPIWTANTASLLFGISLYSTFGFVPAFLQIPTSTGYGLGNRVTDSGLLFTPITVAMLISGLCAVRLTARFGARRGMVVATVLPTASFTLLAFFHDQSWEVAVATALAGFGYGVALSALSSLVVDAVPASQTGAATGLNTNIRTIGGAIGAAIIGGVVTGHQSGGQPTEFAYIITFLIIAAASLLATASALAIPRARTRPKDEEAADARMPEAVQPVG